ncbi:MAG: basic amino acid ABC transporter substrate-binding protein [Fusobacterium sp. JB021]|nr:basic amino acid ABC transporter substrate-binding protein [Fusobacterium sp. JB021]MDP0507248.1 basic amino acid ABC transporter substrate-binding protein [Fusobacterium sp. JB019]
MKKILLVILSLILFTVSFGSNKIYVGTNAEFPPFEYLEKGEMVGFDVDLIEEIGKVMGKEIVMKDMAFDGLIPALQTKKVDLIIAGMTATEDRKKTVNFSDPYYSANQVIVLNKSNEDIKGFEDLKNKKIGVMLGFTGDFVVTEMGYSSEKFNAAFAGIMALQSNKIDAVVLDSETANNYIKKNNNLKLAEGKGEAEDYAIAIRKTDEGLLEDVNLAIKVLKENGKFDELLIKYFK